MLLNYENDQQLPFYTLVATRTYRGGRILAGNRAGRRAALVCSSDRRAGLSVDAAERRATWGWNAMASGWPRGTWAAQGNRRLAAGDAGPRVTRSRDPTESWARAREGAGAGRGAGGGTPRQGRSHQGAMQRSLAAVTLRDEQTWATQGTEERA